MNIWQKAVLAGLLLIAGQTYAEDTVHYYYTDPQGTVLAKADAAGNVIASYDYAPYGSQALGTPPASGPTGYTGHVNDPESGLVYMQARYYDPSVGRFLSVDPVGPSPGNPFGFNRYDYTDNNPINHIDPDGRCSDADGSCGVMARSFGAHSSTVGAELAVSALPVVGDVANIVDAYNDPSPLNITAAVIGIIPEGGALVGRVLKVAKEVKVVAKGAADGGRAGKAFTRAGKVEVKESNAAMHGGQTTCRDCGQATIPAQQSRAGVTPPGNEAHVDHIIPKSKNGNGSPDNGQVLCRDCNLEKSDH